MEKSYKGIVLSGILVILVFLAAYFLVGKAESQEKFTYADHIFQEGVVNEIDIAIAAEDWQDMLENPLAEEYHRADVTINGEVIGNVAIRTKGNTSLTSVANSDSDRYSFKLDFDYYDNNGNYYGMKKLCLNNNYADNSNMREYIAYQIMREMGLPVAGCGYSHITVNGEEWGLYLAVEPIDEVFLQTRFADATGDLYKPEGMGGTGADLVYRGEDISTYSGLNLKTNLKKSDGSEILALMRALEDGEGLEEVLDVENALQYIAANVALANFDSYLGGTTHNYYLYEENGYFSIIPWDLNLAFGGFGGGEVDIYEPASNSMGGGPGGGGGEKEGKQGEMQETQENAPDFQTMPDFPEMPEGMGFPEEMPEMPEMGSGEKPLVTTLLANETYLAQYEGYLRQIAESYLTEEYMAGLVTEIHDLIAPYVAKDATKFCTYEEFEQTCSTDPTDAYSLVYYAVQMAASIENQLAGGEPTFDASSLKGGGMGGERRGKGGEEMFAENSNPAGNMPQDSRRGEQSTENDTMPEISSENGNPDGNMPQEGRQGEEPTENSAMPEISSANGNPDRNMPQNGRQGEQPAENGAMPEISSANGNPAENMPQEGKRSEQPAENGRGEESAGEKSMENGEEKHRGHGDMPGMPGAGGRQSFDWKENLPTLAVCGGAFLVGVVILVLFRRKKELKPPQDN